MQGHVCADGFEDAGHTKEPLWLKLLEPNRNIKEESQDFFHRHTKPVINVLSVESVSTCLRLNLVIPDPLQ